VVTPGVASDAVTAGVASDAVTPTNADPGTDAVTDAEANAAALTDAAAGGSVPGSSDTGVGPAPRRHPTRWRLVAVGAVLVGAFAFLLVEGLGSSLNYFETVDQALQHKATLGTRTFRLEGVVVPGSVRRTQDGVDFVASGSAHQVSVVNHGNPPQLFQPNIPVVVVGHFSGSTFVSDQVIVDHSAQYVQQHPNRVKAPNGTTR
jgi:cytochrome c-type biogenesis protein CcmE